MNKTEKTRKEKIKFLQDIASGNATIEDLDAFKLVFQEEDNTYTYRGKTITNAEIRQIKGKIPPVIILRCEEGLI